MKKTVLFFLLFALVFQFTACGGAAKKQTGEQALYEIGLDLISVMDEMLRSEEYAQIIGASGWESLAETVNTNDYDTPSAVYSISLPDLTDLLRAVGVYDSELWEDLSGRLKEQIENKVSFSTIVSLINSRQGVQETAFSSVYTAIRHDKEIKVGKAVTYLYVFEEGTPIAVTFSKTGGVTGQFVFMEETGSLSEMRSVFEGLHCHVEKVA